MILAGNKVNKGDLKSFEKPRWRSVTDFQIVNIEEKSDIRKLQICEAMLGLLVIFRKNKMKKAPLPKISLLVQIVGEI